MDTTHIGTQYSEEYINSTTKEKKDRVNGQDKPTIYNHPWASPILWKIVTRPTYASGKPCKEHWTNHHTLHLNKHGEPIEETTEKFIKVEWPKSPLNFTLFPKLPPELQTRIWELSLPDPSVIRLTLDRIEGQDFADSPSSWHASYTSKYEQKYRNVNLCVCKESRFIFMQNYVRIPTYNPDEVRDVMDDRPVYFNPVEDTILLPQRFPLSGRLSGTFHTIFDNFLEIAQNVAFRENQVPRGRSWWLQAMIVYNFPRLRNLYFLLNDCPEKEAEHFGLFRMVEVNGDLKRSELSFDHPASALFSESPIMPAAQLSHVFNRATAVHRGWARGLRHQSSRVDLVDTDLRRIKFRTALLAREDDLKWFRSEILYLVPYGYGSTATDLDKYCVYYTIRPMSEFGANMKRLLLCKEPSYWIKDSHRESMARIGERGYFFLSPRTDRSEDYEGVADMFAEMSITQRQAGAGAMTYRGISLADHQSTRVPGPEESYYLATTTSWKPEIVFSALCDKVTCWGVKELVYAFYHSENLRDTIASEIIPRQPLITNAVYWQPLDGSPGSQFLNFGMWFLLRTVRNWEEKKRTPHAWFWI
ncbi:hypothetical protein HYALB_00012149 [Hymenoscyphus albidus]|uniref:2EXR domain-containing protein n=1 Tax=Hymenoscyphus albidus TaxID=595503 RepID=A0A9N9LPM7_9HELO|nr:hypothetical protein HYALB_00012149 [Hymenoscyphus albidus]